MKLTDDEKKILSVVTLQADLSVEAIARRLNMTARKVQYTLKKLGEEGVYYPYPFVNHHRLGYQEFNLFIAMKGGKGAARQRLIENLKDSPAVKHLGVTGGEYQIDVQIWTRDLHVLRETLDSVARDSVDIDYHVDALVIGSITYFAANFLGVGSICDDMVVIAPVREIYQIDDLDRRIIQGLFSQKLSNVSLLARSLGVSPSTLRFRIEKLTNGGVLVRMGYMLNHLRIGYSLVTLLLKVKRPSSEFTERLRAFCIQSRAACFLVECYGSWDYQVGVILQDQTKLSIFIDLLLESFGAHIDRVVPIPSFETVTWRVEL